MPLNLASGDADFTPFLKYNAKAGRFYVRPQGATEDVEVVNPRLAIDMNYIKTGWIYYSQEGGAPEKVWDPTITQMAPRPAGPKKFKRGFELVVFGNDPVHGLNGVLGLREWTSNASNANNAIMKMYEAYEAGITANRGKVPFYVCTRVIPINGSYGTNYEPVFELKAWIDREKVPAFDEHLERAALGSEQTHSGSHNGNGSGNGSGYYQPQQQPNGHPGPDLDDEIPF